MNKCYYCNANFKEEIELYSHILFKHQKLFSPCSTNVLETQTKEIEAIRNEYKNAKYNIQYRRNNVNKHMNKWKQGYEKSIIDSIQSSFRYLESLERLNIVKEIARKRGILLE